MTAFAAVLSSSPSNSTMNNVEPGLLGFLIVAAIGVALVFLLISMNKQFRKLGPPPEEPDGTGADTGDDEPGVGVGDVGDAAAKGAKRR